MVWCDGPESQALCRCILHMTHSGLVRLSYAWLHGRCRRCQMEEGMVLSCWQELIVIGSCSCTHPDMSIVGTKTYLRPAGYSGFTTVQTFCALSSALRQPGGDLQVCQKDGCKKTKPKSSRREAMVDGRCESGNGDISP